MAVGGAQPIPWDQKTLFTDANGLCIDMLGACYDELNFSLIDPDIQPLPPTDPNYVLELDDDTLDYNKPQSHSQRMHRWRQRKIRVHAISKGDWNTLMGQYGNNYEKLILELLLYWLAHQLGF